MIEILLRFCYEPNIQVKDLKEEEITELTQLNDIYQVVGLADYISQNFKLKKDNRNWMLASAAIQEEMAPALKEFKHLSDITFSVQDKLFYLHKAIIGARSIWFESLCVKGTFKEASQSVVKIETMSADVFERVVEFLYTGRVSIPPVIAFEILITANELGLKRLHQLCERIIASHLDEENVIAIALACEYHLAHFLLDECINIMVMHYEKIKHDEDFKNISEATQKKISTLYSTYEKKKITNQKISRGDRKEYAVLSL